jgi:uncharacterized protein YndB with AHSA1/START domain
MSSTQTTIEAIRKTLALDCTVEQAFRTFTDGIGGWWPVQTHSISVMEDGSGAPETVILEPRVGGRLFERTTDGRECEWGSVLAWEPPDRLVLEWRVNPEMPATEIEVRFAPEGGGTRVDLEHRGWESYPADLGPENRAGYNEGWEAVLAAYVAATGS